MKGTYRSRKDRNRMNTKQQKKIVTDILSGFADRNYHIRLKGNWKFTKRKDFDKLADVCVGRHIATIELHTKKGWFRKRAGTFDISTTRRTEVWKRSMFFNWSSYKLHNIASEINFNETMGINLK